MMGEIDAHLKALKYQMAILEKELIKYKGAKIGIRTTIDAIERIRKRIIELSTS